MTTWNSRATLGKAADRLFAATLRYRRPPAVMALLPIVGRMRSRQVQRRQPPIEKNRQPRDHLLDWDESIAPLAAPRPAVLYIKHV